MPRIIAMLVQLVLLMLCAAPLAGQTSSDSVARAEEFAADAYEAYARGEYERAVELYGQALEASPSANIVYNLARLHDGKLRDRQRAIQYYERYLGDTGADPQRAQKARQRLQTLRELERIADKDLPTPAVAAAASQAKADKPAPAPEPVEAKAPSEPDGGSLTGTQVAGIVVAAVGLSALGTGIGFGFVAKADADEANRLCDGNACEGQAGVDAAQSASEAATVADIAFIAGGALTAVGLGLLVFGGDDETQARAGARLSPLAGRRLVGLSAIGRW